MNSLKLFWKVYWNYFRIFIIFIISLCIPIIILISPYILFEAYRVFALIIISVIIIPIIILNLILYRFIIFTSSSKHHKAWILEEGEKLIAIAYFEFKYGYSNLVTIKVNKRFRNKGYGSYFVQWLCLHIPKPIYAYPVFGLADFYAKLGFLCPTNEQLPARLRSDLKAVRRYKVMVYE